MTVVRVKPTNIHRQTSLIRDLFPTFGFISAELTVDLEAPLRLELDSYKIARVDVARVGRACVEIAISDGYGWPAYGKVWVFDVNSEATCVAGIPTLNKEPRWLQGAITITPTMLAELLT